MKKLPLVDIFLRWLHDRGNEIIIISSRHYKVRSITKAWINNNLEYFDGVQFVNPGESKLPIFRLCNVKYWIDDNEIDVKHAVGAGIKTFHIIKNEWGKNIVDGAIRVKGVYNIMGIYNGKEKQG